MPTSSRMRWPYPSEDQNPWYEAFKGLVTALDASGYASREDRHLICAGGGTLSWAAPVFTWTAPIKISAAIPGFLWQLDAGSVSIDDGQVLYVTLTRGITANQTVTPTVANQVPSSDQTLVLAVRIGTRLYLRSGVSIADGGSITEFSPSPGGVSTDRYAPAIIVGNAPAGDTLLNCHYLDLGDGEQLQAALIEAGQDQMHPKWDVWIRPGTYDLGAGTLTEPLTIPEEVRVCGAGRRLTKIRTKSLDDQGAFVLLPGAALENVRIDVATPTDVCSGSTAVVLAHGMFECRNIDIEFESYWDFTEASNAVLRSAFQFGLGGYSYMFPAQYAVAVDCRVGVEEWAPSMLYVGLAPGNEFASFLVELGPSYTKLAVTMDRCFSNGSDYGVAAREPLHLTNSDIYGAYVYGAYITYSSGYGTSSYSMISENHIRLDSDLATARGVLLEGVAGVGVTDNFFENTYGAVGDVAIELLSSSDCTVNGNRGNNTIDGAISLDASSNNNVAIGNNFQGAAYSDLGAGNDLVHNK